MALLQTTRARTQHSASSVRPTTFRAVLLIAAATANCAVLDVFDSASLATHVNRRSTVQDCSALKLNRRGRGLRSLLGLTSKNKIDPNIVNYVKLPELSDQNIVKYAYVALQEVLFHPDSYNQNDSYDLESDLKGIVYTKAAAASESTSRTTEDDLELHSEDPFTPVDHHTIISRKSKYFKGKDFDAGDYIFGKMIEDNANEQGGHAKRAQEENCHKIYEKALNIAHNIAHSYLYEEGVFQESLCFFKKARTTVDVELQNRFNVTTRNIAALQRARLSKQSGARLYTSLS